MKVFDILNIHGAIHKIMEEEIDLDHRLKFRFLGILHEIDSTVNNFEQIRNEKIREYGTKDPDGNISIDADHPDLVSKFNQDIQSLLQEEVSANISSLPADDVFSSGMDISYLVALYPIMNIQ